MRVEEVEYLVLGAGAAGLAAASELDGAGGDVIVLEAAERPGGRILTRHDPRSPVPLELGAEFVHGSAPETLRILAAAGQGFYDIGGSQWIIGKSGWRAGASLWKSLRRVLGRLEETRGPDRSFREFLDDQPGLSDADRQAALAFVEGYHAADSARISELSLAQAPGEAGARDAMRSARVVAGYDRLTGFLADGLGRRLRLGHTVVHVAWSRGRVEVLASSAAGPVRFRAGAAVIALPLGVLQAPRGAECAVTLDPVPAVLRSSLVSLGTSSVARVTLLFDSRFWEAGIPAAPQVDGRSIGFLHAPGRPFNAWWTLYPMRAPVWLGWAGGPAAVRLMAAAEPIEERAITELGRSLRMPARRLRDRMIAAFCHDWDGDPRARGAYSYALVGGAGAAAALRRPIEGTLFLAGEHTAGDGLNGTVEGALVSGRRAARQALTRRGGSSGRALADGRTVGRDRRPKERSQGRPETTC